MHRLLPVPERGARLQCELLINPTNSAADAVSSQRPLAVNTLEKRRLRAKLGEAAPGEQPLLDQGVETEAAGGDRRSSEEQAGGAVLEDLQKPKKIMANSVPRPGLSA